MPKIRPVGHASLAFHHIGGNVTGEMVNTLDIDVGGVAGGFTNTTLDSISQLWSEGPHARHVAAVTYTKVTAIVNDAVAGEIGYESAVGSNAGSGGADMMPLNVAVIIRKNTGRAGRAFRGRMFFGGFGLTSAQGGNPNELDSTFLNPMQTTVNTFFTALIDEDCLPELLHSGAHPPTLLTSMTVHPLVGNMRKRIR